MGPRFVQFGANLTNISLKSDLLVNGIEWVVDLDWANRQGLRQFFSFLFCFVFFVVVFFCVGFFLTWDFERLKFLIALSCFFFSITNVAVNDVNFVSQIRSDWPQMGQIWDFLKSVSVHFGSHRQTQTQVIALLKLFLTKSGNQNTSHQRCQFGSTLCQIRSFARWARQSKVYWSL